MRKLFILCFLLVAGQAVAGVTNLDRLELTPDSATGDALTVEDSSGVATFTVDATGDVTATGAQTFSGAVTFSSTIDFGSVAPSAVTSRTVFLPAQAGGLGGSADPAVELKNDKFTYAFADATTDDVLFYTWQIPDDFDATNSLLHVSVVYLCDQATPTEGEWEIDLLGVADDEADAALGTAITIHDTSPAQNDWSVTSAAVFDAADFAAGDVVFLRVLHDVDDPFCGGENVNFAGLQIGYTTDSNY